MKTMRALLWSLLLLPTVDAAADTTLFSLSPTQNPGVRYRLFPTQNIYTFLRLDTQSGYIARIQWGLDRAHMVVSPLFTTCPGLNGGDHAGRYTLEPTQNIWHFLLLDQETGHIWEVQWSVDGNSDVCENLTNPPAEPTGKQ